MLVADEFTGKYMMFDLLCYLIFRFFFFKKQFMNDHGNFEIMKEQPVFITYKLG